MTNVKLMLGIHPTYHYKILAGERRPFPEVAILYKKFLKFLA